ncbi:MAG: putative phospholipid ABC transporter permease protein MlaE [Fimbriimonadaceae bacterium]|nr:putative phospholipid ABC transporter permease protein MlaE [Fimbriimonadaceae bacterium]
MAVLQRESPIFSPIVGFFTFVGECFLLLCQAIGNLIRPPFELKETLQQMSFVGAASVPIVTMTCFFSGAVLALYSTEVFVQYGATNFAGAVVGVSIAREIAPVLAGIMVAARCGSAMAAQIGTMAVTEQIDALRALNVRPVNYLVIPRLLACVTMVPVLALVGMYAGIVGGYLVSVDGGVASGSFMESIRQFLKPWDFMGGMIKTIAFGAIVAIVSCQQGMRTSEGAVGVGKATTNAVVICMVLIYLANFFLAAWLY